MNVVLGYIILFFLLLIVSVGIIMLIEKGICWLLTGKFGNTVVEIEKMDEDGKK